MNYTNPFLKYSANQSVPPVGEASLLDDFTSGLSQTGGDLSGEFKEGLQRTGSKFTGEYDNLMEHYKQQAYDSGNPYAPLAVGAGVILAPGMIAGVGGNMLFNKAKRGVGDTARGLGTLFGVGPEMGMIDKAQEKSRAYYGRGTIGKTLDNMDPAFRAYQNAIKTHTLNKNPLLARGLRSKGLRRAGKLGLGVAGAYGAAQLLKNSTMGDPLNKEASILSTIAGGAGQHLPGGVGGWGIANLLRKLTLGKQREAMRIASANSGNIKKQVSKDMEYIFAAPKTGWFGRPKAKTLNTRQQTMLDDFRLQQIELEEQLSRASGPKDFLLGAGATGAGMYGLDQMATPTSPQPKTAGIPQTQITKRSSLNNLRSYMTKISASDTFSENYVDALRRVNPGSYDATAGKNILQRTAESTRKALDFKRKRAIEQVNKDLYTGKRDAHDLAKLQREQQIADLLGTGVGALGGGYLGKQLGENLGGATGGSLGMLAGSLLGGYGGYELGNHFGSTPDMQKQEAQLNKRLKGNRAYNFAKSKGQL